MGVGLGVGWSSGGGWCSRIFITYFEKCRESLLPTVLKLWRDGHFEYAVCMFYCGGGGGWDGGSYDDVDVPLSKTAVLRMLFIKKLTIK